MKKAHAQLAEVFRRLVESAMPLIAAITLADAINLPE